VVPKVVFFLTFGTTIGTFWRFFIDFPVFCSIFAPEPKKERYATEHLANQEETSAKPPLPTRHSILPLSLLQESKKMRKRE